MVNISLRDYYKEIDSLITAGQHQEAVDHCVHILTTYPKDLETYRLLGKAFLEANDNKQAADIFGRVLAIRPDDFVANVGMSVIREEEGNLEAAIWHMEKAFELDSSTTAIQIELKRLYTLRDGETPQKIRLTKGALIRMYAKGGMLQQAISEILNKFPSMDERPDIQTLLATLYFQTDQRTAAADLCQKILQNLPYCFDANLILLHLSSSSEDTGQVEAFRNRILETNPYYAFIQDFNVDVTSVPDDAVMIPRCDPDLLDGESEADAIPSWLSDKTSIADQSSTFDVEDTRLPSNSASPIGITPDLEMEAPPLETNASGVDAQQVTQELDLPEWMKESEWKTEENSADEEPSVSDKTSTPDVLAAGIPEWIKEMAPSQSEPAEMSGENLTERIGLSEPLFSDREIIGNSATFENEVLHSNQPDKTGEPVFIPDNLDESSIVPDWLQGFDPTQQIIQTQDFDKSLPGWLDDEESEVPVPENKPFTLNDLSSNQIENPEAAFPEELSRTAPLPPERLANLDKPEWLKEPIEEPDIQSLFSSSVPSNKPDEEMSEWLNKFRMDTSPAASLDVSPDESPTEIPEWLRDPQEDHKSGDTEPVPVNLLPEESRSDTWMPEHTGVESIPPFGVEGAADIPDISALFDEMPDHQQTISEFALDDEKMPQEVLSFSDQPGISEPVQPEGAPPGKDNIGALIDYYSQKLQSSDDLTYIIEEIRKLSNEYPQEPGIWLVLGDAYHHNRQIQAALDAYVRAEEFLRK
jgi:hypothetical protein